jgi:hypothetical protein
MAALLLTRFVTIWPKHFNLCEHVLHLILVLVNLDRVIEVCQIEIIRKILSHVTLYRILLVL